MLQDINIKRLDNTSDNRIVSRQRATSCEILWTKNSPYALEFEYIKYIYLSYYDFLFLFFFFFFVCACVSHGKIHLPTLMLSLCDPVKNLN